MFIVPNYHSILFQQQPKVADPVDPPLPSFLYGFHILFNCSRPEYRLNTARWTLRNNQSIIVVCTLKQPICTDSETICVMIRGVASRAVDRWVGLGWVGLRSNLTKDYTIFIYRFPSTHTALRNKRKDWLAMNQNTMSELSDMSTDVMLWVWLRSSQTQD